MTRGALIVRLLAAAVISLASCWFVNAYNQASVVRYKFDHLDGGSRTRGVEFVVANGRYAYVVPCVLLLAGIVTIWRWPNAPALSELVVSTLWIVALAWSASALLIWQMQNTPIFHGMRLQY
jgi:putative copper export protein